MEKLHKNLFYKCKQNIGHIKKNISIPMTYVADLSGYLCINTTPITNFMPTDYSRQIAMSTNIIGISYKLYYGLLNTHLDVHFTQLMHIQFPSALFSLG
jgi:hypothetical protein